jgi:hypothetical protein
MTQHKRAASITEAEPRPKSFRTTLTITNIKEGEQVHQACLILAGQCHAFDDNAEGDTVAVTVTDCFAKSGAPQHWPVKGGSWKALVMLSSGSNTLQLQHHHAGEKEGEPVSVSLSYLPLLSLPPLHLAMLVAKDSPLLIDCATAKLGSISSAHSDVLAAMAKFRMTAYMWQAMTAEDMRQKGLGRRSFRLDGEWTSDSTSRSSLQGRADPSSVMGTAAKIHMVRTEKTVAELRDAEIAQQNPHAQHRDHLHKIFEDALKKHGAPFVSSSRPVVAGLILDSTYSVEQKLILGHAALGCHKPDGLSLGAFGSHLTYSWPRFIEEVPACLTDATPTDDYVGNDNGECNTMSQACFVGQGAFLHEVGHAFGHPHTTGIMARGYSKHWGRNFVAQGPEQQDNQAVWALQDALRLKLSPHFRLPGDKPLTPEFVAADIRMTLVTVEGEEEMKIECPAGIATITFTSGDDTRPFHFLHHGAAKTTWSTQRLTSWFERSKPLQLTVVALNARSKTISNFWELLAQRPYVSIPGSDVQLWRRSVSSRAFDAQEVEAQHPLERQAVWRQEYRRWTTMLAERGADGKIHRATAVDLRVGCLMDGAVVYYADGHRTNCGPVLRPDGSKHRFGGHASQKRRLPPGASIVKVEVNRPARGCSPLNGIRMTLEGGQTWGELNTTDEAPSVLVLEPRDGEKIVGFYGRSEVDSGFCYEFGILTAPEAFELPDAVYDLVELKNLDERVGREDGEEVEDDEVKYHDDEEDESMTDDE